MNGHSHLEVVCGPMFSGKTEELIRRIRRVEYARLSAIVFKPEIDLRFSAEQIVSHSEQKYPSIPVANAEKVRAFLGASQKTFDVIGFDEVQFFDGDIVYLCEELVDQGARVICAGLSEDFLGRPFGPMPDLLAHADSVTKLWAVCMKCGAPASKSQRIRRGKNNVSNQQVVVGADQCYEARCRACHIRSIVGENDQPIEENISLKAANL